MYSKMMVWGGAAIVGLSLILSACGGATATPDPVKPDPPAAITSTTIGINGFTYAPADITIKVGSDVTFPAEGFHPLKGVTSEADNPIPATSTATIKVTFSKVGKFTYFCQNHGTSTSGMKGTVTVTN